MNCRSGVINLDKPAGMSSAAVVGKVKRLLPRGTKIGHAGTLDPFATGVLLLLVGKATKRCEALMDQPKQYETTVKLGATTATDDPESAEQAWVDPETGVAATLEELATVTRDQIDALLRRFIGEVQQRPPAFSALRIDGRRAYDLARAGHDVRIASRPVRIYAIELLAYDWPLLRLRIDCGRGTYIRSLGRDIGGALKVGGYLTQLRRTRIGAFDASTAVTLDALTEDNVESYITEAP